MSAIRVLKLGTRVLARAHLDGPEIPGKVEGAIYNGAGLRYVVHFDNNFTQEVLDCRVREAP